MLVLAGEFPEVDERLWRAAVDRVLARYGKELSAAERDALFQRTMTSKTYDGIAIKALYTARDLASIDPPAAPGFPPFVRGATIPGGIVAGWDVRQRVDLEGDGSTTA
jgi:methylmalonyl-CoA mutase